MDAFAFFIAAVGYPHFGRDEKLLAGNPALPDGTAYTFLIVVSLCRIDRTVADLNGIRNATLALLGSHLIDAVTQNGHLDAVV